MSGAEPLILAAAMGGTALEYAGQQQAKRERRKILNQAFDDQRRTTEKSAQMLADEGAKYGGDRQQSFSDQEAAIYDQTQKDLAGAGGDMVGSDTGGNVSSDFMKAKADKALAEGSRLTAIAREAAKLRAPGMVTSNEKRPSGRSDEPNWFNVGADQEHGQCWRDGRAVGSGARLRNAWKSCKAGRHDLRAWWGWRIACRGWREHVRDAKHLQFCVR